MEKEKIEDQIKKEKEILDNTVAAKNLAQANLEDLESQKNQKLIELHNINDQISDGNVALNALKSEHESTKSQHVELVSTLASTGTDLDEVTATIAEKTALKESLEDEIDALRQQKEAEATSIKSSLATLRATSQSEIDAQNEQISRNAGHIKGQESMIKANEDVLSIHDKQIIALNEKKDQINVDISNAQATLNEVQQSTQAESEKLATVKNELQGAITELATTEFQIKSKKEELVALNNEAEELNKQKFAFQSRVSGFAQREAFIKAKYEEAGVPWQE